MSPLGTLLVGIAAVAALRKKSEAPARVETDGSDARQSDDDTP